MVREWNFALDENAETEKQRATLRDDDNSILELGGGMPHVDKRVLRNVFLVKLCDILEIICCPASPVGIK